MTVVTNPACNADGNIETTQPSTSGEQSFTNHRRGSEEIRAEVLLCLSRLCGNELQSDVIFVAGINGDTLRIPANRRLLSTASPVFSALLSDMTSTIVVVDYVDHRGFEQLLRYYYSAPLQITSVFTARTTLHAAYSFLCPELAEMCAKYLDEALDAEVALEVLRDLRFLCIRLPGAASAPPLPTLESDAAARFLAICSKWCDSLAHNALLVIDDNADATLNHKYLEEFSYEDLSLIVKRNTLRVSTELVLAEALARWSTATCKRMKREITPSNKRAALGELAYCPRYLLLSGQQLDQALALELLEPIEKALVIARARNQSAPVPVGSEQDNMLRCWAAPRPTQPASPPVHLSVRSKPLDPEPNLCSHHKKKKQPVFESDENNASNNGCCSDCCMGLLHALVCLFD